MRILSKSFLSLFLLLTYSLISQEKQTEDALRFSMESKWSNQVTDKDIWNNYPRPQLDRGNWTNLNGLWEYAITPISDALPKKYDGKIRVPFPVESELSKVKKMVGPDKLLWYRTSFSIDELKENERLLLNFGAVDWETVVYLNGALVGSHKGGYTAFSMDIAPFLTKQSQQELVVKVWDPTDANTQARGKQVREPKGIWYTPVTGIWQTVWLEKTNKEYIKRVNVVPNIDKGSAQLSIALPIVSKALQLRYTIKENQKTINSKTTQIKIGTSHIGIDLSIPNAKLWSPESPFLYDLELELTDLNGTVVDKVSSYFGMRKIALGKDANGYTSIHLNNKPLFQFGLLDQGWWPDGLYTAPTEEAMMYDVEMTKKWGFNMLRKHVKVEPARFYYNCDKMGMLVWQDMPNGNYFKDLRVEASDKKDATRLHNSALQFEAELKEMMDQFAPYPSIVVWVPFNEGWGQYDTERIAGWVKNYDPSRLCNAPSGWADRGVGDLIDVHIYPGPGMENPEKNRASVLGEFGGLGWPVENHMWWDKKNWGYLTYNNQEDFTTRFKSIINDMVGLKSWGLSAAIYTQTTDVEGEVNGLMTYDRKVVKIDPSVSKPLFAPLYQTANSKTVLLPDSEHSGESWKVSYSSKENGWKSANFNDADWPEDKAPFSSFRNPYLKSNSDWNSKDTLLLRKTIYVTDLPENINLKYYLHQAKMKVYINGKEFVSLEHEGGRKRHYTNNLITSEKNHFKLGKNVISVEVVSKKEDCSFDLGMYTSSLIKANSSNE